jgi:hypothetical protein
MPLTIFSLFVFSDWESFVLARSKVEIKRTMGESKGIRGYLCFVSGYNEEEVKKKRGNLSFDELNELGQKCKIAVNELPFSTWEEYFNNIRFLEGKNQKDVFGAIQVEVQ